MISNSSVQPEELTQEIDTKANVHSAVEELDDIHTESDDPEAEHKTKFRAIFGLLSKMIGVKDIISLRVSLPSQLLDPIPNLEHWNYMDRPDFFSKISDSDDSLDRMISSSAWWFTKDLKYVHQRLMKPYNSVLGEQFLCKWTLTEDDLVVKCLTEQISHHPPVSAFYYACEEKGIFASGIDHICAKFTGTSVKISSGEKSTGIHLVLKNRENETYSFSHPIAHIVGWLRGHLYPTVSDYCVIHCPKTQLVTLIEYKEERWIGKARFAIDGKIFKFTAETIKHESIRSMKIPKNDILATLSGSWKGKIYVKKTNGDEFLLVDMEDLSIIPKEVKPLEEQGDLESRKIWAEVTENILKKDFSKATKSKRHIEERQRQKAHDDKLANIVFESKFFTEESLARGKPELKSSKLLEF